MPSDLLRRFSRWSTAIFTRTLFERSAIYGQIRDNSKKLNIWSLKVRSLNGGRVKLAVCSGVYPIYVYGQPFTWSAEAQFRSRAIRACWTLGANFRTIVLVDHPPVCQRVKLSTTISCASNSINRTTTIAEHRRPNKSSYQRFFERRNAGSLRLNCWR